MNPVILYDNILDDATLAVTDTATGYNKENLKDLRKYTWWLANSIGLKYVTANCGYPKVADAFGLSGHNLGSAGVQLGLEYSSDNFLFDVQKVLFKRYQTVIDKVVSTYTSIKSIFVYDTRLDSDGGAWRKGDKARNSSWHNEVGEFPEIALFVLDSVEGLAIYDLTDISAPMWMFFDIASDRWLTYTSSCNRGKVVALNGQVYISAYGTNGNLTIINFIADYGDYIINSTLWHYRCREISRRNETRIYWPQGVDIEFIGTIALIDRYCWGVNLTVLPDAPTDSATGLPTLTVCVPTEIGLSVINDDGTVADLTATAGNIFKDAFFDSNGYLWGHHSSTRDWLMWTEYDSDAVASWDQKYNETEIPAVCLQQYGSTDGGFVGLSGSMFAIGRDWAANNDEGLTVVAPDLTTKANGMVAFIGTNYNTGWMPGDIRGAWLSDGTAETIGVDEATEYHDDGNAASDNYGNEANSTTGWGQVGLDQGANIFQSQASVVDTGSYAIQADSNDTPTGGALFYKRIGQDFGLTAGKMYKLSFAARHVGTGEPWHARLATSLASYERQICALANTDTTWQDFEVVFKHASDTEYFLFREFSVGNSGGVYFDNFSVVECGNLVENGKFPLATWGWTGIDSTLSVSSGQLVSTNDTTAKGVAYQAITTEAGKRYEITLDFIKNDADGSLHIGTAAGGNQLYDGAVWSTTQTGFKAEFTATTTTTYIGLVTESAVASDATTWDNISVRKIVEDRSVKQNGLALYGQLTKSTVENDTELMGFTDFSTNDFLEQPYSSGLDFGTDNFCFAVWANNYNNSSDEVIFSRAYYSGGWSGSAIQFRISSNGKVVAYISDDGYTTNDHIESPDYMDDGQWHFYVFLRRDSNLELWIDGVSAATPVAIVNAAGSLSNSSATLMVGLRHDIAAPFAHGTLTLLRSAAYAPSQAQIEKMYRDEKKLFETSADCLVAGTSDSITDLSYDKLSGRLHAATSWGRSEFNGLERVASEATGIGAPVAVSVLDGTIGQAGASGADVYLPDTTYCLAPDHDKSVLGVFNASIRSQYWRIVLPQGTAAPKLAVPMLGRKLTFPLPPRTKHDPRQITVNETTRLSQTGNPLGTVIDNKPFTINAEFIVLNESWVADTYWPFWENHFSNGLPCFWALDLETWPDFVCWVWRDKKDRYSTPMTFTNRVDTLKISMTGMLE